MRLKARHFILGLSPRTATVRLAQTLGVANISSSLGQFEHNTNQKMDMQVFQLIHFTDENQ